MGEMKEESWAVRAETCKIRERHEEEWKLEMVGPDCSWV